MADVSLDYQESAASGDGSMLWLIGITVVLVAGGVAAYLFLDRPPKIVNTPMGMLHELCNSHRIKGRPRKVLEDIAEAARLDHPACLFLGQSHFDAAVASAQSRVSLDKKQTATIGLLRRKLFSA